MKVELADKEASKMSVAFYTFASTRRLCCDV